MKVSSDVYTSSTRGRKFQADAAFSGRSMVEMLGVLAIIGVLSVGAITGYQKAMMKYKLNKQSQQITQLLSSMIQYHSIFADAPNNTSTSFVPIFKKLNVIPLEMIKDNSDKIYDAFNMKTEIRKLGDNQIYYSITAENFIDSHREICLNVFKTAIPFSHDFRAIGINSETSESINQQDWYWGDNSEYCTIHNKCAAKLTQKELYNLCEYCDQHICGIHIVFE